MNRLIEAIIITESQSFQDVSLPQVPFIPTDMAFDFKLLFIGEQGQFLEACLFEIMKRLHQS